MGYCFKNGGFCKMKASSLVCFDDNSKFINQRYFSKSLQLQRFVLKKPPKRMFQGAFLYFKQTTSSFFIYDVGKLSAYFANSFAIHHYTVLLV